MEVRYQRDLCADAILELLDSGVTDAGTIRAELRAQGFSVGTIHRAIQTLGIVSVRQSNMKPTATWSRP